MALASRETITKPFPVDLQMYITYFHSSFFFSYKLQACYVIVRYVFTIKYAFPGLKHINVKRTELKISIKNKDDELDKL